jgi:Ser/Thr protein kinase RdoA (MazF antagonist)
MHCLSLWAVNAARHQTVFFIAVMAGYETFRPLRQRFLKSHTTLIQVKHIVRPVATLAR